MQTYSNVCNAEGPPSGGRGRRFKSSHSDHLFLDFCRERPTPAGSIRAGGRSPRAEPRRHSPRCIKAPGLRLRRRAAFR
jgi:hypothetical protein